MKILMVNKFHYIKGGSETYYFALKRKLEENGHMVIDFSMKDPKNFHSPYESYFVENIDYGKAKGIKEKIRMAAKIIYSFEARKKLESLIKMVQPDIMHLHIFQHQLSPSILDVAKKYNIPTVYTAHDLKMICLNYKMMHHGKICEECKDGHYYHCLKNKCVKESFVKSGINVLEGCLHRWRKSYEMIDIVITPSFFYKKKFEEFGISPEKIVHIPNFLDCEKPKVNASEDSKKYYLYFGRLSEEKGVLTLVKALERTEITLYIVGTGPLQSQLGKYILDNKLENIHLLGFREGQELTDLVGNAKAVIIPSEWYENGPYSVIEALQVGRPVIGAEIGGIPELIDGNGFLFESGNSEDLLDKIQTLENLDKIQYNELENKSYQMFERNYTWSIHFEELRKIYEKLLSKRTV